MNVLPAFFQLHGQNCLVVGGGVAAGAKTRLLLRAGATVFVVAPVFDEAFNGALAEFESDALVRLRRRFRSQDVAEKALVIAVTGSEHEDAAVAGAARTLGVPVNVVDRPELSSFIVPAIVDRESVVIGISTGGTAPVLARRLRARIEAMLPARIGRLAAFAGTFRQAVAARVAASERRRFWESFFDGPVATAVLRGDEVSARERMIGLINRRHAELPRGVVHIVGAGPGDPDLLTLKALRVLQDADVIVYDKLIGAGILDLARRDAKRIYVGKSKAAHSVPQEGINALLAHHATAGRRVVRLKGGDPFVFGRGGEEMDYLLARDIAVEIVPGVTAATGCAAYTGIPLTHRDHAAAVTFISGHAKHGEPDLDWQALASLRQTLVVYMGLSTAGRIAARLIEHDMSAATPVAVIENGTHTRQRVAAGHLGEIETLIVREGFHGPALLVIGEVARYADTARAAAWPLAAAE